MGISSNGMTISLNLSTKGTYKKHKARTAITDINNQHLTKFIKEFKKSPYLCCNKNQVHNEPTKAYFFLIKKFSNLIKNNKNIWLRTKQVKSDSDRTKCVNGPIEHVNKKFIMKLLR